MIAVEEPDGGSSGRRQRIATATCGLGRGVGDEGRLGKHFPERTSIDVRLQSLVLATMVILTTTSGLAAEPVDPAAAVAVVLDDLHRAAAEADGERYFGLFATDAVFLGTDVGERWTMPQFRAFAEPYFSQGRGWTYTPLERHVELSADGHVAWFDEILLNDAYGTCRGTGVLVRTAAGWRIAQYHLTIPIPNELAGEIAARIREHGRLAAAPAD